MTKINELQLDIPYGNIYTHDASTPEAISNGTAYTKLTSFTNNGLYNKCTLDASNNKITITKPGIYKVICNINGASNTVSTFLYAAFLDGVEQDQCHAYRKYATANDNGSCGFSGIIDVESSGLDLDVRARHDSGTSVNLTIAYMSLVISYLGET